MSSKESTLKTWKIIFILYLSIEKNSFEMKGGWKCAALAVQDVPCTLQKRWVFWSQFLSAPPHLDTRPAQSPALLLPPRLLRHQGQPSALAPISACTKMLLYQALSPTTASCPKHCWTPPLRKTDFFNLLAGARHDASTAHRGLDHLPWDTLHIFLQMLRLPSFIPSSPLCYTHVSEHIVCRDHKRACLSLCDLPYRISSLSQQNSHIILSLGLNIYCRCYITITSIFTARRETQWFSEAPPQDFLGNKA